MKLAITMEGKTFFSERTNLNWSNNVIKVSVNAMFDQNGKTEKLISYEEVRSACAFHKNSYGLIDKNPCKETADSMLTIIYIFHNHKCVL